MKIIFETSGPMKRKLEKNPIEMEIEEGTTLLELMQKIGWTENEAGFMVYIRENRGGNKIKLKEKLNEGDHILAVLQVGGG